MTKKIKKVYIKTMFIISLPMLYVMCLYLYSSRNIVGFLYPMIVLGILIVITSFYLIHQLLYGKYL